MKKYLPALVAAFLFTGCSSNGGTESSGDGLGFQTTASNLLLTAALEVNDSISADVFQNICEQTFSDPDEEGNVDVTTTFEPGIKTITGTMSITSRDLSDESGLTPVEIFPEGVNFTKYRVSYSSPNPAAPRLKDRVFLQTFTLANGAAEGSFTVVLLDLDLYIAEFVRQSSRSIASYNVKVTAEGTELNGQPVAVSAQTFLEIGDFDNCDSDSVTTPG
jgi:hypothetical protein